MNKKREAASNTASSTDKKDGKTSVLEILIPAVLSSICIQLLLTFVVMTGIIPSASMEPTVLVSNSIVTNRLSYLFDGPEYDDIIVFDSKEYDMYIIKRVIGLPGDTITISNGFVYRNGEKLLPDYTVGTTLTNSGQDETFVVPDSHVFLLGDNRENSTDSRYFESPYIPYTDIVGKTFLHISTGGSDGMYIKTLK